MLSGTVRTGPATALNIPWAGAHRTPIFVRIMNDEGIDERTIWLNPIEDEVPDNLKDLLGFRFILVRGIEGREMINKCRIVDP
jgi:hypothetical protein